MAFSKTNTQYNGYLNSNQTMLNDSLWDFIGSYFSSLDRTDKIIIENHIPSIRDFLSFHNVLNQRDEKSHFINEGKYINCPLDIDQLKAIGISSKKIKAVINKHSSYISERMSSIYNGYYDSDFWASMIIPNVLTYINGQRKLRKTDFDALGLLFGHRALKMAKALPKVSRRGATQWLKSDFVNILCQRVGVKSIRVLEIAYN